MKKDLERHTNYQGQAECSESDIFCDALDLLESEKAKQGCLYTSFIPVQKHCAGQYFVEWLVQSRFQVLLFYAQYSIDPWENITGNQKTVPLEWILAVWDWIAMEMAPLHLYKTLIPKLYPRLELSLRQFCTIFSPRGISFTKNGSPEDYFQTLASVTRAAICPLNKAKEIRLCPRLAMVSFPTSRCQLLATLHQVN